MINTNPPDIENLSYLITIL